MRLKGTGVTCGNGKIFRSLVGFGLALAPALCPAQAPATYTISTIAGTGTGGYAGDAGPANAAQLNGPCALAVDHSGNLYIADSLNFRVRKMAIGGTINTVVGTGTAGDTTGAATSAQIRNVCGLLLDSSGNLYVADTTNHEVKKVTSGGTLSTVAGTGTGGFSLDGNPAAKAQLDNPTGLALTAGGVLYIADTSNQRLRSIDTNGIINTAVGNGTAGYLGDGGPPGTAELNYPKGLAMDAAGNLYIADTNNGVIRKVAPGGAISTVAGTGVNGYSGDGGLATQAQLNNPKDVAVDAAGNLYIADTVNCRIRLVTPDGVIRTVAGNGIPGYSGDGGSAALAQLQFPAAVRVDAAGNLYIADYGNHVVRQLTLVPPVLTTPPSVTGVLTTSLFGGSSKVAPGSWIEVHGSNLAAISRSWTLADFKGVLAPTSLEGTSVTIGGQSASIASISPAMLLVQVPAQVTPGPQPLIVQTVAGANTAFTVTVNALQPGIYAPANLVAGGKQYTAEFNDASVTFVMPAGAAPGSNSRPAHPGDIIVVWGVGFGPVMPGIDTGHIVQEYNTLNTQVQFTIAGVPATVLYQGLAPQEIGLYQFDIVVPNVNTGGAVPLNYSQGGVNGTQPLYVAIQN